jgi:hypothetical protein
LEVEANESILPKEVEIVSHKIAHKNINSIKEQTLEKKSQNRKKIQ